MLGEVIVVVLLLCILVPLARFLWLLLRAVYEIFMFPVRIVSAIWPQKEFPAQSRHGTGTRSRVDVDKLMESDYLGKAATAQHEAREAIKDNERDKAWKLFHEQKSFYLQHANKSGFSERDAICLDSSVHEDMANMLRLEGKHSDALIHILYWVIASSHRPIKRHDQKLRAYFNRCKFESVDFVEVEAFVASENYGTAFMASRNKVAEWIAMV